MTNTKTEHPTSGFSLNLWCDEAPTKWVSDADGASIFTHKSNWKFEQWRKGSI